MEIENILENVEVNNDNKNKGFNLKEINNDQDEIGKEQKSFLETNLGQTINWGINLGIRATMPDLIEDEIIGIKDAFIQEGFMRSRSKNN